MPRYVVAYYCRNCERLLTRWQVTQSDGVCPLCGVVNNSTIVDHVKRSVLMPPAPQKRRWWDRFLLYAAFKGGGAA